MHGQLANYFRENPQINENQKRDIVKFYSDRLNDDINPYSGSTNVHNVPSEIGDIEEDIRGRVREYVDDEYPNDDNRETRIVTLINIIMNLIQSSEQSGGKRRKSKRSKKGKKKYTNKKRTGRRRG